MFWGLLACEILNGKGRDVVENTTVKKLRDLIEKKHADGSINDQQFSQYSAWLIHWLMVYCFTSKTMTNTCLLASLLSETGNHNCMQNVVQMKAGVLSRYMIASFILGTTQNGSKYQIRGDSIEKIALPLALNLCNAGGKDELCRFLKALYEEFDMESALKIIPEISKALNEDFLLKPFAAEITKQVVILAFKVNCKLFKTVSAKEFTSLVGAEADQAFEELKVVLLQDGFTVKKDKDVISTSPSTQ